MKQRISLQVNGAPSEVEVDPAAPLLYVLRNELGLNGPKYGCGLEQCGACLVVVDGEARPSCRLPVAAVEKRRIITLEGLVASDGSLHPLQEAFVEEQAAQCGFCLNGALMAVYALLERDARPDATRITQALDRSLCRCGTHSRIIRAAESAVRKLNGSE